MESNQEERKINPLIPIGVFMRIKTKNCVNDRQYEERVNLACFRYDDQRMVYVLKGTDLIFTVEYIEKVNKSLDGEVKESLPII